MNINDNNVDEADSLPQLTDKQENFISYVCQGKNNTEAYSLAYNTDGWSRAAIWTNASKLASSTKVALWMEHIRQESVAKLVDSTKYTQEAYMAELSAVIKMALSRDNPAYGPAIQAIQAKGKTCGHMADNSTTTHIHTADRTMLDRIEQTMGSEARQKAERSMGMETVKH